MLLQYHVTLSPRHAQQLLWSRCINIHGMAGKNIPIWSTLIELPKTLLKDYIGANKTQKAISRVGKALGTISPVLDNFDKECGMTRVWVTHEAHY